MADKETEPSRPNPLIETALGDLFDALDKATERANRLEAALREARAVLDKMVKNGHLSGAWFRSLVGDVAKKAVGSIDAALEDKPTAAPKA